MSKGKIFLSCAWEEPEAHSIADDLSRDGYDLYYHGQHDAQGFSFVEEVLYQGPYRDHFATFRQQLDKCDACVVAFPSHELAYTLAGYAIGCGKPLVVVLLYEEHRLERMYKTPGAVIASREHVSDGIELLRDGAQVENVQTRS